LSAPGLVTRPRLLAALGERFDRRLVLMVAGAGFGKSTLLSQAVAENRLDPRGVDVWLSCTPDDAAASQLAAGLLAAARRWGGRVAAYSGLVVLAAATGAAVGVLACGQNPLWTHHAVGYKVVFNWLLYDYGLPALLLLAAAWLLRAIDRMQFARAAVGVALFLAFVRPVARRDVALL